MSVNYNDENVKKILESEKIPERLEPENIKKLLDDTNAAGRRKKIRQSKMLRIVSAAAAFALVIGTSAYFLKPAVFSTNKPAVFSTNNFIKNADIKASASVESMKPAVKYGDIYSYFHAASNFNKFSDFISGAFTGGHKKNTDVMENGGVVGGEAFDDMSEESEEFAGESIQLGGAAENADIPSVSLTGSELKQKKEYSDTYNQEEGVLEADIVKTDGERIFYASNDTISVAKVDSGKFSKSYKTNISSLLGKNDEDITFYLNDMYIYNNKLILICSAHNFGNISTYEENEVCGDYSIWYISDTYVLTVSIGDQLTLDGYYIQDGCYNDVRLMANGYMYLVTNDEKTLDFKKTTEKDIGTYIPEYCVNGECGYVPADDIMIPREKLREVYDYVSYVNLAGLDLNSDTPWQPVDMKSIAGYSNNIYCSQKNLYIASGYEETEITRFSLENGAINIMASGKVKGYVNDQFSMSEYNDYFRIAVTENNANRNNAVYVLGMDMKVVGSVSDFGINEQIKSVNFSGDMAYVVTFRNTDPLFAIDLSDPANPKLLDELKISGYSTYMQKWSDGLLVGFGAEADENNGGVTGVKLTMFDNSDPENLKAVDYVSITGSKEERVFDGGKIDYIEEYVSSEGTYERKALYIDPERNIIGFPIQRNHYYYRYNYDYEYDYGYDYDDGKQNVVSSYMFYSFDNGNLVFKGELKKEYDVADAANESFSRAVYIDGYLYVVSADMFKSADAVTFKQVDSLENF